MNRFPILSPSRVLLRLALTAGVIYTLVNLNPPVAHAGEEKPLMVLILRPSAGVPEALVRLVDLVELAEDPLELARPLGEIFFGLTPVPGEVRELTREQIRGRLDACGFSPERIRLEGSERVVIYRGKPSGNSGNEGERNASSPVVESRTDGPAGHLRSEFVIHPGDRLQLRYDRGILEVEEPVEALEAGRAGELIECRSDRTGATIQARVTGRRSALAIRVLKKPERKK